MLLYNSNIHTNTRNLKKHVRVCNGMLAFQNMEDFMAVAQELENISNGANAEDYFNEFEKSLGFHSLRKVIETRERGLLLTNSLTADNDPDNFFVQGDIIRTLLNPNLEIQVGKSIYKFINEHDTIEILDSDCKTLELARKDVRKVLQQDNVVLHDGINNTELTNNHSNNLKTIAYSGEAIPNDNDPVCKEYNIYFSRESNISGFPLLYRFTGYSDPRFYPIKFIWEITDANTAQIIYSRNTGFTNAPTDIITFTFPKEGPYQVCLTIEFNDGTKCKTCGSGVFNVKKPINPPQPNPPVDCCVHNKSDSSVVYYGGGNFRMVCQLSFTSSPIGCLITAKTKNEIKKRNRWKRLKASNIEVGLLGKYYFGFKCDNERLIVPARTKSNSNDSKVSVTMIKWPPCRVSNGSLKSNHIVSLFNINVDKRLSLAKC